MNYQDAYTNWVRDPDAEVLSVHKPKPILRWLKEQSPDDWHAIATTWNYDYGFLVLAWILRQDACDKGTAANIFLTEAEGWWLDGLKRNDPRARQANCICNIVLDRWDSYSASELTHGYQISDRLGEEVEYALTPFINDDGEEVCEFESTPMRAILEHDGGRRAVSDYVFYEGGVRLTIEAWAKRKGIVLT